MVARHSDTTKLNEAKQIAKEGGCFVLERSEQVQAKVGGLATRKYWLLYRQGEPNNIYVGKRTSIGGICQLVNAATKRK